MKKNYKAKLLGAIAALGLAVASTVGSTYAWFSMNAQVTATGMQVRAKAEGSLVISDSIPTNATTATIHNFNDSEVTGLYASTHDWTEGTTTGLKYVTNPGSINPETGTALNGDVTLSYADAVNVEATQEDPAKYFYKDYLVYLAAVQGSFDNQDIVVSLSNAADLSVNGAISVDFYSTKLAGAATTVEAVVVEENYQGTLNLAKVKNANDNTKSAAYTELEIEEVNIPQAAASNGTAIAIAMRVYYDGALIETSDTTSAVTTYQAGQGNKPDSGAPYYYLNDKGEGIASLANGADTSNYYVVTAASAKAFARNTSIANIADVTLSVVFNAKDHD